MFHILIGRAGSGKTTAVMNDMRAAAEAGLDGLILLVPPQASHNAERALCEALGDTASLSAEALTFRTLANRIFEAGGHLADHYIDDNGRLLLIRNAKEDVADILKAYAAVAMRPEFIEKMLMAINELKLYGIGPQELYRAAALSATSGGARLTDLAMIYAAYDALLTGELHDPADLYDLMLETAEECGYFRGKRFWIDAFNGFTPKEYQVLEAIVREAEEITLVLTADARPQSYAPEDLFYKSYDIMGHFIRFAERLSIPYDIRHLEKTHRFSKPSLAFLERELVDGTATVYEGEDDGGVEVISAPDKRRECELCASVLIGWAKEGVRFREMVVICRNYEDYAGELESVFRGCEIPVHMDNAVSVVTKQLFRMLLAALEACTENFSLESMTSLLKTGMTGIPEEDLDMLEYYMIRWNIRGSKWITPSAWKAHPDGYMKEYDDDALEKLARLNTIREKIITPLAALKKRLGGNARAMCTALYDYAVTAGLCEANQKLADNAREAGNGRLAEEYDQLWEVFCDTLDQFVLIAGDREYSAEEFCGMLRLLLSGRKVGAIPAGADQVMVGEAGRYRGAAPKRLYVLGNNEGVFPRAVTSHSLISDEERLFLREQDIYLDLTGTELQFVEQFLAYQTFFAPSEKLVLSYIENQQTLPSVYAERVCRLMPWAMKKREAVNALYLLKNRPGAGENPVLAKAFTEKGIKLYTRGETLTDYPDEPLRADSVKALYGDPLRMTPSRIERYHSCRFAFFVEYGLGVREFRAASFSAIEEGDFIHYVFEKLAREVTKNGGFGAYSEKEIVALAEAYTGEFYDSFFDAPEYRSSRTDYLFKRLSDDVKKLAAAMRKELERSHFEPYLFEQSFGRSGVPPIRCHFPEGDLQITGVLDRADRATVGGKKYIRLVDYKTGHKEFSFRDLYHGLNTQLPTYLFKLLDDDAEAHPAGFFYLPSRYDYPELPKDADAEKIAAERAKLSKYKGLLIDDLAVMEAMDPEFRSPRSVLPVVLTKSGVKTDSPVADESGFAAIRRHMEKLMRQMNAEIRAGTVKANPITASNASVCRYCKLRGVCKVYPETAADAAREIGSLKCQAFFDLIRKEGD